MEAGTFRLCYANRATRRRLRSVLGARAVPAQQTDDVEIEKKKRNGKGNKKGGSRWLVPGCARRGDTQGGFANKGWTGVNARKKSRML